MKIRETYEKVKNLPLGTHFLIYLIAILGGCAIGLIGAELPGIASGILLLLGFMLAICGILWWILFLKCPHCGRHLRLWVMSNYCPGCGEQLI